MKGTLVSFFFPVASPVPTPSSSPSVTDTLKLVTFAGRPPSPTPETESFPLVLLRFGTESRYPFSGEAETKAV
ncbi:hypothetical protein R6Q59_025074 [Mikania micrantha]